MIDVVISPLLAASHLKFQSFLPLANLPERPKELGRII
jgi:hypothetical protein